MAKLRTIEKFWVHFWRNCWDNFPADTIQQWYVLSMPFTILDRNLDRILDRILVGPAEHFSEYRLSVSLQVDSRISNGSEFSKKTAEEARKDYGTKRWTQSKILKDQQIRNIIRIVIPGSRANTMKRFRPYRYLGTYVETNSIPVVSHTNAIVISDMSIRNSSAIELIRKVICDKTLSYTTGRNYNSLTT